jgi:outer membrane protein OmpA-like peptidoglycan-associated protein
VLGFKDITALVDKLTGGMLCRMRFLAIKAYRHHFIDCDLLFEELMISRWLSAVVFSLLWINMANAVSYGPNLNQAEWRLELSPFECRMSQPIPSFGEAVFSNRAGEEQLFYLSPVRPMMKSGKASLISQAPVWDESRPKRVMAEVDVKASARSVELDKKHAYQLLNELYAGMSPIFTHYSWFEEGEPVDVFMSSVHFRKAYSEYKDCLTALLPVNFEQINRSRLNFKTADWALTAASRALLDNIILYVKTDPVEISFYIDGHTDSVGRRLSNLELSKKRAESVTAYLAAKGISDELITTRYHGERYPVTNNATASNRAANRRVTIRLERDGDI